MAFAARSAADAGSVGLPSPSFPAIAAAPLAYVIVPSPLGATTWSEREWGAVLLGATPGVREDTSAATSFILMSLHASHASSAFALEITEAPPEGAPRRAPRAISPFSTDAPEEVRLVGALEAMGLKPEDLVEKPELSAFALFIADALASLDRAMRKERVIAYKPGSEAARLRVDPEERYLWEPGHPKYGKPPPADLNRDPPLRVHAKRIARSIYKILLGVAIGVLIWGFVRNT